MDQRWEYESETVNIEDYTQRDAVLNRYGDVGWELVGVVPAPLPDEVGNRDCVLIFKRPKRG